MKVTALNVSVAAAVAVPTSPTEKDEPAAIATDGTNVLTALEPDDCAMAVGPVVVVVPTTTKGLTPAPGVVGVAVTTAPMLQMKVASALGRSEVVPLATICPDAVATRFAAAKVEGPIYAL